jgi:phosphoribosylglycinamide formyltransferase-1
LQVAQQWGVPTAVVDHTAFATRTDFEHALADQLDRVAPDLIVLAGFMRVLSPDFVARYAGRLINIHPSLLPAFPGLDTHRRALAAGVAVHGATVHRVTAELDHGPILAQAAVPVLASDDAETLAARVLRQEHELYPRVIEWLLDDRVHEVDGRVSVAGPHAAERLLWSAQP